MVGTVEENGEKPLVALNAMYTEVKQVCINAENEQNNIDAHTVMKCVVNNNNVHLSCAHQRPERSHDTY